MFIKFSVQMNPCLEWNEPNDRNRINDISMLFLFLEIIFVCAFYRMGLMLYSLKLAIKWFAKIGLLETKRILNNPNNISVCVCFPLYKQSEKSSRCFHNCAIIDLLWIDVNYKMWIQITFYTIETFLCKFRHTILKRILRQSIYLSVFKTKY